MRLLTIASRSLRQRLLTSVLTTVSILLGTGLVSFLWLVADQAEKRYHASSKGYRVILGPKDTSPLGIVLSTVFHIGMNMGVIPLSVYRDVHDNPRWKRGNVGLRYAIPVVSGDNYKGFPIIGTTDEWFTMFSRDRDEEGKPIRPLEIVRGRRFAFGHADLLAEADEQVERIRIERGLEGNGETHDDHEIPKNYREAVLGAGVASKLGLGIGDRFVPAHGVEDSLLREEHEEAASEVVGILEKTLTAIDQAIYVPIGLCYRVGGHNAVHPEEIEIDSGKVEISAVIIDTKGPLGDQVLRSVFQRREGAQAAMPRVEIRTLFTMVGDITLALRGISYLVLLVGAIAIFISLYNTMHERRREVAIMRSLGARRTQILGIVLLEALLITGAGAILGVLGSHTAAVMLGPRLESLTGVPVSGSVFGLREFYLILGVSFMGCLAGLLPAFLTSMTDVARHLSPDR
ncbi:MAG: ABC transporter permease [Planctomycetota bacterium]